MELQTGDVAVVEGIGPLAGAINLNQKINSKDNKSEYQHALIITSPEGDIFESVKTIRQEHIDKYTGKKILIARPTHLDCSNIPITDAKKQSAIFEIMMKYEGLIYPFWRLPLFLIPPLAKYGTFFGKFPVCSELAAAYLKLIGARNMPFTGVMPDTLADEWVRWHNFEIVYEGKMK